MIQLENGFRFTNRIQPICLPKDCSDICEVNNWALGSGWGQTNILRSLHVQLGSNCQRNQDNQLCIEHAGCQVDDGGPVVCRKSGALERRFLNGIRSVSDGCDRDGQMAIFSKPCAVTSWIESYTGPISLVNRLSLQPSPAPTSRPRQQVTTARQNRQITGPVVDANGHWLNDPRNYFF